ncbi:uncharacterized protein TA18570 [Theileria annulata]|uniref:Hypothtical protein n=1 Tax=Theileria annulata TaxID=5874 RepID=Q4UBH4_THEAN|nr:uncharacterized protein TA18570 [Theileria annulata]CAI75827.1 hypothtical protein [Theileria annulata]|eukprot:XP_955303.1 hypothtical protein [Theileria annulata]
MGNKDDLTIYNISDNLKERLQGGFRWNLTDELLKRLESGEKNTKDLLAVNEWFKEELETIVSSRNAKKLDPTSVKLAKSILDLIYLRSVFDLDSQQIFIYTAPYVQDRTYKLLKGSEVNNKSNFSLEINYYSINRFLIDVCMSFEYYKCNNSTPNIVEDCINSKIIRFSNLFTNFCKYKGINCDLKPLRNNSDCEVTVYGRIGSEAEGPIDQLNVTLQGTPKYTSAS